MTDDEQAQACADAFRPLADAAVKLGEAAKRKVYMINCYEECDCGREHEGAFYAFSTMEKAQAWLDKVKYPERTKYRIEEFVLD